MAKSNEKLAADLFSLLGPSGSQPARRRGCWPAKPDDGKSPHRCWPDAADLPHGDPTPAEAISKILRSRWL